MAIEDTVLQKFRDLPPDKQREVLAYLESLIEPKREVSPNGTKSVLDSAGTLIGSVDGGPGDLSTNPDHLEGYGR